MSAVARLLTLDTKLDVGYGVQAFTDGLLALSAETEELGLLLETRQRLVDLGQNLGPRTVAFGCNDLAHFHQRLLVLVPTDPGVVLAYRLDGHVALREYLGT